jgi:penicillin-binding protein 1A
VSRRPFTPTPIARGTRRRPLGARAALAPVQLAPRIVLMAFVVLLTSAVVALGLFPLFGATGQAITNFDRKFLSLDDTPIDIPAFAQRSTVFAANGSPLATLADYNRVYVPLKRINEGTRNAVLAIEDDGFYNHGPVDVLSILRAAIANLQAGRVVQGGSTISQQLVKNTQTGDAQTFQRKFKEAQDAIRLEREYTKDQIFEKYLNLVYFGNGAYGIAAAAEYYFAVPVEDLKLSQAALLAGLINSPATHNPVRHPENALVRRNEVLRRMLQLGWISTNAYDKATARALKLSDKMRDVNALGPEPYFMQYVKNMILHPDEVFPKGDPQRGKFIKLFGKTPDQRKQTLFQGGLRIYTTLEPSMQREAADSVEAHLPHQGPKPPADPEGAVVTIVPSTGAIEAMYGGANFDKLQLNLATQARRTAGSSFKAFTLASAFEQGIPVGKVYDGTSPAHIPLSKCPDKDGEWTPHNAADGEGAGFIDMALATADSINAYFAQLIADVGPSNVADAATRMGVVSYDRNANVSIPPVCAITLGTVEVNPLSMTSGYSTLANQGRHCWPYAITKIATARGRVLYKAKPSCQQVLDPAIAAQVTGLLRGVVDHGTGTAAQLIGRPVAGKTGTGQSYQDAWFMGYVPQLVSGVWVGYSKANSISMDSLAVLGGSPAFGGTIAAPIWHDYMQRAVAGLPVESFPAPPAPKSGTVPNVVGMTQADAEKALAKANFTASATDVPCVDPVGIVCAQSPAAGAKVTLGSVVHIDVSNGKSPKIKVPNVIGSTRETATAALKAAGFSVTVALQPVPTPANDGLVLDQSPKGGAMRKPGSTVLLVVGKFGLPSPTPTPSPTPPGGQGTDLGAVFEQMWWFTPPPSGPRQQVWY